MSNVATYTFYDANNNPTSAALNTFVHLSIDDGATNLFADDYADIRLILGATYQDVGGKTVGVCERWLLSDPAMVHALLQPYLCPDWNATSGAGKILNKPTLSPVATSGNYNDLSNRPTIPAAQIQSDWNQSNNTAADYIKNKPTITSGTVTSVGVASTDFSVTGSPVTTSGNFTLNLNTTGVSAASYNNVTVDTKGRVTAGQSLAIAAPSTGNTFASGTAFQPRSGGSCMMNIQATLSGIVGVTGTVTVAMSSTQNGTYTNVSVDRLLISVSLVTADQTTSLIPVPSGYWIKVTLTGGITATYTRWDL